ncbi:MAG: tetratricopeptide repeat protein [Longimicrobiales bacterium]
MPSDRSHATILFTDIVGSTARAAELGDQAWRDLLRRHDVAIRACLRRYLGRELNAAGDGFVARFDDPVRALLCAAELRDSVQRLGLSVRCGVHLGQIEGAGSDTSGIAVHIGARVAAQAGRDEILVSRGVRDSVQGAGFGFKDLGSSELRGVEGEWRLYRLTGLPAETGPFEAGLGERLRYGMGGPRTTATTAIAAVVVVVVGFLFLRPRGPTPALASEIRSVAVLPLANLSGDPGQEYFAEGMTEAMITELSKIAALRVISRTSAMRYSGSDKTLPEIADELGVEGLVEGSVVRDGDQVRITAQLIHAGSDSHVWADSYDGELRDVLRLQSEVATAIARAIEVALTPEERARLAANRPVDPEAYEAYLRGTFHLNRLTADGIERGLAYLHDAVEADPASALAYAGLALGYSLVASHTPSPPPDAFERAQAAYERALELDETLAEAHGALAEKRLYRDWDWAGAERSFERALDLNPNLPRTLAHYAWLLTLTSSYEEAGATLRRAQLVDPLTPLWFAWAADLEVWAGDYDEAVRQARKALDLNPDFPWAFFSAGSAFAANGMHAEALAHHQKAVALDSTWLWALGLSHALAGRAAQAREIASGLERESRPNAFGLTLIYAGLGDREGAMRWLGRTYEQRHPWTPWLFTHFVMRLLHDDPRFQELARRLGLPNLPVAAPVAGATARRAVQPGVIVSTARQQYQATALRHGR